MPKNRRPSQFDIARLAEVSQTTVSIVLNERDGEQVRVSPDTRERVLQAARELGYVANPAARSLAGGRNNLLGVFTYETIYPIRQQNYYYPFLVGIEEQAGYYGYDLLLFSSAIDPEGHRSIFRDGVNRLQLADGSLLLGFFNDENEIISLINSGYPFVFVGRREVSNGELSYVEGGYGACTQEIVTHIIAQGHRRIAYVATSDRHEPSVDRETGYYRAHEQAGLAVDPALVVYYPEDDLPPEFLQSLIARGATALVLEHDQHYLSLIAAAQALQVRIPQDLSMVVLNPVEGGEEVPEVAQLIVPRREMGIEAVRVLHHLLTNPEDTGPHHVTVPCQFLLGGSIAKPTRRQS